MRFFNKNSKKSGFTLMEIAIAVLIVSILLLTCVPIVKDQLKKSDEYAYYLAFKTVEKLGGQIAALGDTIDPDYNVLNNNVKIASKTQIRFENNIKRAKNSVKLYFVSLGAKFVNSERYLFTKLFPSTYAGVTDEGEIFDYEIYNAFALYYQYCEGKDVYDPEGRQDKTHGEDFLDGRPSVEHRRCDYKDQNCCNEKYVKWPQGMTCQKDWKFKPKYERCVTTQTKNVCEKGEDGKKVDPDCEEVWTSSKECTTDLESCSETHDPDTSTKKTEVKCRQINKEYTRNSTHILKEKEVKDALQNAMADASSSELGGLNNAWSSMCDGYDPTYYPQDMYSKHKEELDEAMAGLMGNAYCDQSRYDPNDYPYDTEGMYRSMLNGTSASSFCTNYGTKYCTGQRDPAAYRDPDESYFVSDGSTYCQLHKKVTDSGSGPVYSESPWSNEPANNTCKPEYGYYNMENIGGTYNVVCQCKSGYTMSENNDKVCCQTPSDSLSKPYALSPASGSCVNCASDFNSAANRCCPEHSVFNGTECECVEGYTKLGSGTSEYCERSKCSKGSFFDSKNKVCVNNPPVVKAENFCKTVARDFNVDSSNCSTFSEKNGVKYYPGVFNAAKGTAQGNDYLSIMSQKNKVNNQYIGPFHQSKNLTPNIVFANGLKMWILGDRAASIAGLSYNPTGIKETQNMCKAYKHKTSEEDCKAADANAYFCKSEKHCYNLDNESRAKMGDARNCCGSVDLNNLAAVSPDYEKDNRAFAVSGFTVFVDINGNKGGGILWEDVFPFFVGTNGTVYAGYPLDAPKSADSTANSLYLGGNSVSNLTVDVYYYTTDASQQTRKKVIAYPAVSFARGVCSAKLLSKNTPYCMNLGEKYNDPNGAMKPCDSHRCFIGVRNKLRFF